MAEKFTFTQEGYDKIVAELDACRKRITALAEACSDIKQVYRLNLQLFPLSKEIADNKED